MWQLALGAEAADVVDAGLRRTPDLVHGQPVEGRRFAQAVFYLDIVTHCFVLCCGDQYAEALSTLKL